MPIVRETGLKSAGIESCTLEDDKRKKPFFEKIKQYANSVIDIELDDLELTELENEADRDREECLNIYLQMIEQTMFISLLELTQSRTGCLLFDELCLRIDINQRYALLLPQWNDLAVELNIDKLRTQWVQTCVRPQQGLTRALLEIYMHDSGTLGDVLNGLLKLGCLEILEKLQFRIRDVLAEHESRSTKKVAFETDSMYYSVLETLYAALPVQHDPCSDVRKYSYGLKNYFLKNSFVENSQKMPVYCSELHMDVKRLKVDWQPSRFDVSIKAICRILLLFAEDGVPYYQEVLNYSQGYKYQNIMIEVFCLNETSLWYELLANPEACCMKWTQEADFVMPILSPQLIKQVLGISMDSAPFVPTSAMINRFIYNLLRAAYTENGCRNIKVRPVVPQEYMYLVTEPSVKYDPLFRLAWVPLSSMEPRLKSMMLQCPITHK